MFGMDFGVLLWFFGVVIIIVLTVLSMLMPIFVMQIRDSIRRIEKQISTLVVNLPESR